MLFQQKTAKRSLKILSAIFAVFSLCGGLALAILRGSLPQLDGKRVLKGLKSGVLIERDGRSVPHISAKSRADVCRALGFLHAQERFFQMDLLRRVSAGELSELFGSSTVTIDQRMRPFNLREVACQIVQNLPVQERGWLDAYTKGINEGLGALQCSSFEYWLLRSQPAEWRAEDVFLVCYNLFSSLQDFRGELTKHRETLYANLPKEVARFFTENGSIWEARIDNSSQKLLPIPNKEHFAYLSDCQTRHTQPSLGKVAQAAPRISEAMGSNCWALTSDLTENGEAIVVCDMHLRLGVPNIWYRASMSFLDDNNRAVDLHGATIPGIPALIMGTNGRIGWGFTNAQLNTTDLMRIERQGENDYKDTQGNSLPLKKRREIIKVRGKEDIVQDQLHTHWGPLVSAGPKSGFNAMHWIGLDARALDLSLMGLESANDVQEAVKIATAMRAPVLNFFVADTLGQIGWALSGSIPKRTYSARRILDPLQSGWCEMVPAEEMPRQIFSKQGRLWNANHSMLSSGRWGYLGTENMLNAIRGYQIRSALFSSASHSLQTMHRLQHEVRAPFFERWQTLLQNILIRAIEAPRPETDQVGSQKLLQKRKALLSACRSWDGHCKDQSTGYCAVRRFRDQITAHLLSRFLAPCFAADPTFSPHCFECEESIYQLVSERPPHLADPQAGSWDRELLGVVDEVIAHFDRKYPKKPIEKVIWGDEQILKIQHPLSKALGWLSRLIDLPSAHMGGDKWVPKVLCETFGASQRMILCPGQQELCTFEMPGGQSGNPLSKHYRDLHQNWMNGKGDALLPLTSTHRLFLTPPPGDS